jgi:hypothetical protein
LDQEDHKLHTEDLPGHWRRQLATVGLVIGAPPPGPTVEPAEAGATRTGALHLARLVRMDQIVDVRVPSVEQEASRDSVRAGEDVRGDLMRCRTGGPSSCCAGGWAFTRQL